MQELSLPNKPKVIEKDGNKAVFEISPCYPGYGLTLGNALRRVLLSGLSGAAVTAVKINGASHEFSTIPYVLEDVIDIILNLKQIRFKMFSDEPIKITLAASGEKKVKAGQIKTPSDLEIVNKNLLIATLTDKKAKLEMELQVEKGLGYLAAEQQQGKKSEIGLIAIDAIFSPIRKINYRVENVRVGKMTDWNRLLLEVETDGSITPEEAFDQAGGILVDYFEVLRVLKRKKKKVKKKKRKERRGGVTPPVQKKQVGEEMVSAQKKEVKKEEIDLKKTAIADLNLPTRIINILSENRIKTVASLIRKTEEALIELPGLGPAGVKEIKKEVGKLGLVLKE